jgi:hypothetical protein
VVGGPIFAKSNKDLQTLLNSVALFSNCAETTFQLANKTWFALLSFAAKKTNHFAPQFI